MAITSRTEKSTEQILIQAEQQEAKKPAKQWTDLNPPQLDAYLSNETRKQGTTIGKRIEEVRTEQQAIEKIEKDLRCPIITTELYEQGDTLKQRTLKVLTDELAVRMELQKWYEQAETDRKEASKQRGVELEQVKEKVRTDLKAIGYNDATDIKALVQKHPQVKAMIRQYRPNTPNPFLRQGQENANAIKEVRAEVGRRLGL